MLRGFDECILNGITDFEIGSRFKIFRCKHYVYCPLCGWRCKSEEGLLEHLNQVDDDEVGVCEGHFYHGHDGVVVVKNELKYWSLYEKMNEEDGEIDG